MIINSRDFHALKRFQDVYYTPSDKRDMTAELEFYIVRRYLNEYQNMIYRYSQELPAVKKTDKSKFEWQGYVNVYISRDMVDDVRLYLDDTKTSFMHLTQMIADGYRLKMDYDPDTGSCKATAICHAPDDPNFGYAMSAWADDWRSALAVLCFKHFKLTDEHWLEYSVDNTRNFG